ncbi:MAG TPA: hypothetical protein VIW73_00470 [Candidatus Cybelea sp.]
MNPRTLDASSRGSPNAFKNQPNMTVLLIDHHRARFFDPAPTAGGLVEGGHLEPLDPHGFRRHLEHRKEADYQGQRVPEADEFYERVAARLRRAGSILILGDATGKSSAMRHFVEYLKERHKEIADRVVAAEDADLSAISLGEIEALARRYA